MRRSGGDLLGSAFGQNPSFVADSSLASLSPLDAEAQASREVRSETVVCLRDCRAGSGEAGLSIPRQCTKAYATVRRTALAMGYEERGLFEACQRWFGASPSVFRAQSLAAETRI